MNAFPLPEQASTPFDQAVRFLARSSRDGGIYGLQGSAPALTLAAAVREGAKTLVSIVPDGDAAAATASDVRFYLGKDELSWHPLEDQVIRYPSSDVLPYSFGGLETDVWVGRMAGLFRLAEAQPPSVVSVALDALIRKVIPRRIFQHKSFSLSTGEEIDRELVIERLVACGYSRVPLVEDAGDFSVQRLHHRHLSSPVSVPPAHGTDGRPHRVHPLL